LAGGRKKTDTAPAESCRLKVPRAEAEQRIHQQVDAAAELVSRKFATEADVERLMNDAQTWVDVTTHVLKTLFTTNEEAAKFADRVRMMYTASASLEERLQEKVEDIGKRARRLDSVLQRLDLFEHAAVPRVTASPKMAKPASSMSTVFIVHGHDVAAKQEAARLVEKLGLKAIILDEQTNRGRTIIEKFEDHAGEAGFAIVLLTPDDVGKAKDATELKPRARQNVIMELGYFLSAVGRGKVCALHKGGLDLPSDIQGVIYISFDGGAWKLELAKEMKDAGVPVDLNDL
jgi:predicted nucleotide-binding protein